MRKLVCLLIAIAICVPILPAIAKDSDWYEVIKTITLAPGEEKTISILNGLPIVANETSFEERCPEWLKTDMKTTFDSLLKCATRLPKSTFIQSSILLPDNKEILVLSAMGKAPIVLELPSLKRINGLLPDIIDTTARLAISDIDSDGSSDLVVCPVNGGWFYLSGPTFSVPNKPETPTKEKLFPLTTIDNPNLLKLEKSPEKMSFMGSEKVETLNQSDYVSSLPKSYGAMTSIGFLYVDDLGFIRKMAISNDIPTGYSTQTITILPTFDEESSFALGKDMLAVGSADGSLSFFKQEKDTLKFGRIRFVIDFKISGHPYPQFADINSDGEDDLILKDDSGIYTFAGPSFANPKKINVPNDGPIAVGDLDGDKKPDLIVASVETIKIYKGPDFRPFGSNPSIECGKFITLAIGDLDGDSKADIVLGNREGTLCFLKGPYFRKTNFISGIDVGDYSSPCIGDINGDGMMDLIVTNVDGKSLCFKNSKEGLFEFRSWAFTPDYPYLSVGDYFTTYYKESSLLFWDDDTKTIESYRNILNNCPENLLDETAFSIANTNPEVLRTVARMGQASIFQKNAKLIYDYDKELGYVELIEKGDWTTAKYKLEGVWHELPRDDYYWFVVHPRCYYEFPLAINASWWDKEPQEYGIAQEDWWKHAENIFVGQGTFWREGMATDKAPFGETVLDAASKSDDYREAIHNVHMLIYPSGNQKEDPRRSTFGYLTQDIYPWHIFKKRYGSCGEQSIMACAVNRTALIPTYVVADRGEDHQWNEVWMPDGWTHLEPSSGKDGYFDSPFYEGQDHKWKSVSTIMAWRGDDSFFPTTTSVKMPKKNSNNTFKLAKGYTATSDVTFKVVDKNDTPIEAALLILKSGWQSKNLISFWGYTNSQGICKFELGYEPYYIVDCITPYGVSGFSRLPIAEGKKYNLTIEIPGIAPSKQEVKNDKFVVSKSVASVEIINNQDELRPPNLITSGSFRPGSYLFENFAFYGTQFSKYQLEPENVVIKGSTGLMSVGKTFDVGESITIANPSKFTYKKITLKFRFDVGTFKLDLNLGNDNVSVPSGSSFNPNIQHDGNTPLTNLAWSWDGKSWNEIPFEGASIETGLGGPPSPGTKNLQIKATALYKDSIKEVIKTIPVELTATNSFFNQPVFQDHADPLDKPSWVLGPFSIPKSQKYLKISTATTSGGLDLDLFLYKDKNDDDKPQQDEQVAASNGPSSFEKILVNDPEENGWIIICHGCTCTDDNTSFDIKLNLMPSW
jgi:hypothetical protein